MESSSETLGPVLTAVGAAAAFVGAAGIYYLSNMPETTKVPTVDLEDQSYALEVILYQFS